MNIAKPAADLVLRDVHASPVPPWWPPAPGWWLVFASCVLLAALAWWWQRRRLARRRAIERVFDDTIAAASTPAEEVAAISELLRRAARRHDPDADRYLGERWLQCLDAGMKTPRFASSTGHLLLQGGFRREVDPEQVAELRGIARTRYLEWMRR